MRKTILILLAVVSSNSMAEWVAVTTHDSGYIYADPSTIIRDGNQVKMWTLVDYKTPRVFGKLKPLMSMKSQIEFDCKEKLSRGISSFAYPENMGGGEAQNMSGAGIRGFDSSQKRTSIPPNTIGPSGYAFWKFACEKR
jgi:hypothetical protein